MNTPEDTANEPGPPCHPDPIARRLLSEAMAERRSVTPALHRQIMERVHGRGLAPNRRHWAEGTSGIWRAVAAALVAGAVLATWRIIHPSHGLIRQPTPLAITNIIPAPNQIRQATAPPEPMAISVNVGDILSASIWPPEVRINLPIPDVMPSAEPVEPQSASSSPGPPEWALSRLQEPASSAQSTLADLVPPNLRSLSRLLVVRRSNAE